MLNFLCRDYIESLGGKISSPSSDAPPKTSPAEERMQEVTEEETIPNFVEEEMDTSQLVCDGVIGNRIDIFLSPSIEDFYIEGLAFNVAGFCFIVLFFICEKV